MDHAALHRRAREKGVQPIVYWLLRAILQPFFHLYFRLSRIGREHVPQDGPVIIAANHRSFLDPFVIATIARRPRRPPPLAAPASHPGPWPHCNAAPEDGYDRSERSE